MNAPDETEKTLTKAESAGPRPLVICSAITLYVLLSLWTAAAREYWSGETQAVQATREVAEQLPGFGVLVPTISGDAHFDQPLYYWLASVSEIAVTALGEGERLALRIPAALFAVLSLWLTLHLGTYLFDRRIGFLAMVIQATSCFFFFETSWLSSELCFASLCQLAVSAWVIAQDDKNAKLASRWRSLFWIGLTGACLAGSPLTATTLVFVSGAATAFFSGGTSAIRADLAKVSSGKARFAILIAFAWYVYVAVQHPETYTAWIAGSDEGPEGATLSSSCWTILWGFLPWIIFLPLGLLHGKDRMNRLGERFCMCQIFSALLLFLLLPGDRVGHVLFIWPALSLLIPAALYETGNRFSVWEGFLKTLLPRVLPYLLKAPLVIVIVTALLWLTEVLSSRVDPRLAAQLESSGEVWRILFLMAVGGGGCFWVSRRVAAQVATGETPAALFETARAVLFLLVIAGWTMPFFDASESPRAFLAEVEAKVGDASLVSYGVRRPAALPLYLAGSFEHIEPLDPRAIEGTPEYESRRRIGAYLNQPKLAFLLISKTEYEGLGIQSTAVYRQLHATGIEGRMGDSKSYMLLANREPNTPAPKTTPEPAPKTTPEPAPKTTPEPAPKTTPEPAPKTAPEPAPKTSAAEDNDPSSIEAADPKK